LNPTSCRAHIRYPDTRGLAHLLPLHTVAYIACLQDPKQAQELRAAPPSPGPPAACLSWQGWQPGPAAQPSCQSTAHCTPLQPACLRGQTQSLWLCRPPGCPGQGQLLQPAAPAHGQRVRHGEPVVRQAQAGEGGQRGEQAALAKHGQARERHLRTRGSGNGAGEGGGRARGAVARWGCPAHARWCPSRAGASCTVHGLGGVAGLLSLWPGSAVCCAAPHVSSSCNRIRAQLLKTVSYLRTAPALKRPQRKVGMRARIYAHTYTHMHAHARAHSHSHACMHACMHTHTHTCTHAHPGSRRHCTARPACSTLVWDAGAVSGSQDSGLWNNCVTSRRGKRPESHGASGSCISAQPCACQLSHVHVKEPRPAPPIAVGACRDRCMDGDEVGRCPVLPNQDALGSTRICLFTPLHLHMPVHTSPPAYACPHLSTCICLFTPLHLHMPVHASPSALACLHLSTRICLFTPLSMPRQPHGQQVPELCQMPVPVPMPMPLSMHGASVPAHYDTHA